MLKNYNDEKFTNVINSLRELPHIPAPNDFEVNLKRELNTVSQIPLPKPVRYYSFSRKFAPAFGLAAILFLIFLMILNQGPSEIENPFLKPPSLRTSSSNLKSEQLNNQIIITENDVVIDKTKPLEVKSSASGPVLNNLTKPEFAAESKKNKFIDLIYATTDENNIDKSLRVKPGSKTLNNNNTGQTVDFNGFNIIQDEDQTMDELRARMDSLKKETKGKNK
ncbi:MAG: hypothetical protein NTX22_16525 [Ignavibacteriales bacterium]|nr:hypothetical protein [Ignavibacteriales bacterium]